MQPKLRNFKNLVMMVLAGIFLLKGCDMPEKKAKINDQFDYALSRKDDLQLSTYITAHAIDRLLADEAGRREALSLCRCNGITKVYLEVYRSGLVIEQTVLEELRDFFTQNGIEVVGGIATVPGENFGVRQEGPLGWFNWQHPKTQDDLKAVMRMSAAVFDEFIVDDFLCTGDTSAISKEAKGERSWSQYRRDLLTQLSEEIFLNPAREVNPDIHMIIKYPQWYDRFHLFGYDLEREPALYDEVWVGTETRGQYTQRYGFVQPHEGFVNYRWIKDIAGEKIGGAWFDHGDCVDNDFYEQAWQSVLAGAKEIVVFNYFDFVRGHPDHHLIRTNFEQLADLARYEAKNPVKGIAAYKPLHSDAGGDLYLMDFIGMLGIPMEPLHQYPESARVILLPTQAAKDADIAEKVKRSLESGATVVFTTGFLANAQNSQELCELAGLEYPVKVEPVKADQVISNGSMVAVEHGLDLEAQPVLSTGEALLVAKAGRKDVPFLTETGAGEGRVLTLNTHTFSQDDFDAVGEVLLCPKPLGLLEIPVEWANTLRNSIISELGMEMQAKTRFVVQPLGSESWMFHNYNREPGELIFKTQEIAGKALVNALTGEEVSVNGDELTLTIPARSRIWVKQKNTN